MIASLLTLVIYLIVIGLVFYLLWWMISLIPLPEPFGTVVRILLALVAVLIVVYLLLGLVPAGHGVLLR